MYPDGRVLSVEHSVVGHPSSDLNSTSALGRSSSRYLSLSSQLTLLPDGTPIARSDLIESDTDYTYSIDLPGYDLSDITIRLEKNNLLSITATHQTENEGDEDKEGKRWHFKERRTGISRRLFALPEDADFESIDAQYQNGVVKVVVNKLTPDDSRIKPRVIPLSSTR